MSTTLQEQAWQSGLVLLDETAQWDENVWPNLEGGERCYHASVVLDSTVVVLGGHRRGHYSTNSVLELNLAQPDQQWREGPPMNKKRRHHAAVACNGGIYVMGGNTLEDPVLDCIERIDVNHLLESPLTNSTTHASPWTTLNCRLSTRRRGCCAVAVHNRYIVVIGGMIYNIGCLSSVEIIDTRSHTVTPGPSMNIPRQFCSSAVIGNRIFVVGGCGDAGINHDSVEYLEFAKHRDIEERNNTLSTFISSLSVWTTHSDLVLSGPRYFCAVVTLGSCLVMGGGYGHAVEILDTHRNRVWNLPSISYDWGGRSIPYDWDGCSIVKVANQITVIGGRGSSSCVTLPLMDKSSWCFRRLCEQPPNHFRKQWAS